MGAVGQNPPDKPSINTPAFLGFLAFFLALCTIFALLVTVGEAWQEHAQIRWPAVTATVRSCNVAPAGWKRRRYLQIVCDVTYLAGGQQRRARLRSSTSASVSEMNDWVNRHEKGSAIEIHYDPARPTYAVLLSAAMPGGGPHTAQNVKFLAAAFSLFVLLFTAAKILAVRQPKVDQY